MGDGERRSRVLDAIERRSGSLTALGALLIPVVVAFLGAGINDAVSQREVSAEYLDLAITILSQPPIDEGSPQDEALREYAVALLAHSSPVELPDELRQQLLGGELLPPLTPQPDPTQQGVLDELLQRARARHDALVAAAATQEPAPPRCRVTVSESAYVPLVSEDPALVVAIPPRLGPGAHAVTAIRRPSEPGEGSTPDLFLLTSEGWAALTESAATTTNCGL